MKVRPDLALLVPAWVVALIARAKLRRSIPPALDETMERAREDVAAMLGRMEAER